MGLENGTDSNNGDQSVEETPVWSFLDYYRTYHLEKVAIDADQAHFPIIQPPASLPRPLSGEIQFASS